MQVQRLKRKITKVCQDCWYEIRPNQYFPDMLNYGDCDRCGNWSYGIARVRADEVKSHPMVAK